MPLTVLLVLALVAGATAGVVARRLQRRSDVPGLVPLAAAEGSRAVRRHPRLQEALSAPTDPAAATGLGLTVALVILSVGGLLLGALALSLRANPSLFSLDARIAAWAHDHATSFSTRGLDAVTQLGATSTVIVLAVALAIFETVRLPNRWIGPFLLLVVAGQNALSTMTKELVDRARPTLNPIAETLGPSFPSGHTTAAAAFFAAAALLLGRRRSPRTRAALAGVAVGVAVAVAASRVLLDVHWVSDVVGGLALGWAWFAVCAIAFGGRLMRFGVTAKVVQARSEAPREQTLADH